MTALSTITLLSHPDRTPALFGDPAQVAGAVAEFPRDLPIARRGPRRTAVEDLTTGGVTLRTGAGAITSRNGADRDPSSSPPPPPP